MQAMVQDKYGSAAVLERRDIDRPEIGDDQVLIRVRAAGVNIADWAVMSGLPYIARPVYGLRKPKNTVRGRASATSPSRGPTLSQSWQASCSPTSWLAAWQTPA
jgi:hypothetical protein